MQRKRTDAGAARFRFGAHGTSAFRKYQPRYILFGIAGEHDLISKAIRRRIHASDAPKMSPAATLTLVSNVARTTRAALALHSAVRIPADIFFSIALAVFYRAARENTFNMLWAVLFGFATLNILGLAARRMEPRRGLSLGEVMAVLTVILAVFLLGWEMLGLFHIFPIKLR